LRTGFFAPLTGGVTKNRPFGASRLTLFALNDGPARVPFPTFRRARAPHALAPEVKAGQATLP
jgi:hypothetical protein